MMERAIQERLDLVDGMVRLEDLDEREKGQLFDAVDARGIILGVDEWLWHNISEEA